MLLAYVLLILAAAALLLFLWIWNNSHPVDYLIYNNQTISYDKGKVIEILNEDLQKENETSGRMLGTQRVLVQMNNGERKGERIEINNILSTSHNIPLSPGDSIIVKVDAPENVEPFYSVYNYDRTGGIILICVIFLLLLVFVGKSKGLRSALGIAFTLLLIIFGLLPMLYHGYSPVLCCFVTIMLTSTVCLSLLSGISKRTLINPCLGSHRHRYSIAVLSAFYSCFELVRIQLRGGGGTACGLSEHRAWNRRAAICRRNDFLARRSDGYDYVFIKSFV